MTSAASSSAASAPKWIVAPVVAMAAFMEVLDLSIANVALPHIAGSLSATRDQATWVLTSYLVTNAIVLPVSGWLSSVLGRKRFYMLCIAGFSASSLLCGLAPSLPLLILFRTIQGLTGGGLQPASQAILSDTFPPHQRGMAFAAYGMAVVFAPAIGPTLGGWITDNFSWHWIFLINVPVGAVLLMVVNQLVRDPEHMVEARQRKRDAGISIDYIGFGLLALGLGFLQVLLDRGQQEDWFASPFIVFAVAVAAASLIAFVVWELGREDPIVDLALFKDTNFAIGNALMFVLGFILLGTTALLPLYVQTLMGYTATEAGMVLSPGGFALMFLMPFVGRMMPHVDPRRMLAVGIMMCVIGIVMMSHFNRDVDFWTLAVARIVQASGLAFLFIPITVIAYAQIPMAKNNNASALLNLSRNLGGSVGIAVLTTLLSRGAQEHHAALVRNVSRFDDATLAKAATLKAHMMAAGADAAEATNQAYALIAQSVAAQADTLAFLDDFRFLAVTFTLLLPVLLLLRRPKNAAPPQGGH